MNSCIRIYSLCFILMAISTQALAQRSLYQDVKARHVGDIITVLLEENISGSSTRDARTTSNALGQAAGSVGGNIIPFFQPFFSSDASVNYNSDERFLANQRQLLQGHLSVRIVEVTPIGDMLVEGTRVTEINGELHEVSLKGVIRSIDIDNRNQVPSYRVANAEISYMKKNSLKQASRRPGMVRRIALYTVGLGITAAILVRELR